mgnify:CR=1 FL=1
MEAAAIARKDRSARKIPAGGVVRVRGGDHDTAGLGRVELDLFRPIRSTPVMRFYVTHVMCQHIEPIDVKKHIKHMARQRCVGARGNSTGYR